MFFTNTMREISLEEILKKWTVRSGGRIRAWATILGRFTLCSDDLFRAIKKLADNYGVGTTFHMASSIEEAHELEKRTGAWPITQLERLEALGPNVLLTHVIAIKDEEIDLLAKRDVKVAHCPGAALRLAKGASRIDKIPDMLQSGVTVSLGADGVCSCGTFDPTRLMFVAAGLFKDARMHARMIPAETALEMATINGARSLLWDREIGSIEVGKKADPARRPSARRRRADRPPNRAKPRIEVASDVDDKPNIFVHFAATSCGPACTRTFMDRIPRHLRSGGVDIARLSACDQGRWSTRCPSDKQRKQRLRPSPP